MESDGIGYEVTDEEELAAVEHELSQVAAKINALQDRQQLLLQKKRAIKDRVLLKRSEVLASKDWSRSDFPWSQQLMDNLKAVFNMQAFRPHQEAAMNAVLSKEDTILVMPTGGGKSLCYQLLPLLLEGFVLVVCPLVSLMEDQMIYLRKIKFSAYTLSQNTAKEEVNLTMTAMSDKKAPMKLLYVTPERMAKSKRFMNKLQSAFSMGRLSCIAIDEVHCCSQWGHDFRPDYKYLGVLKGMFPGVPILGLTATATSKIIVDAQKILNIEGCVVIKSSFNRPNLFYEVRVKPSRQEEYLDELEDLLKMKYASKSGIIYTTTIKDAEETVKELRRRSINVVFYHSNMDPGLRLKAHHGWVAGKYQAVVATIAFGMGIDKPDVRFVIHQTISKSMENYYQESGRAGRDGQPADCVVFYRLPDVFKASCMGFSEHNALENLYSMVDYCLNVESCRRCLIASHFDEVWEQSDCKKMCDICRNPCEPIRINISHHCITLYSIIERALQKDTKLTVAKLLDAWFNKGPVPLRLPDKKSPTITLLRGEQIIAYLLIHGFLKEDFHYTAYSCLSYLKKGPRALEVLGSNCDIMIHLKGAKLSSSTKYSTATTVQDANIKVGEDTKNIPSHSLSKPSNFIKDSKSKFGGSCDISSISNQTLKKSPEKTRSNANIKHEKKKTRREKDTGESVVENVTCVALSDSDEDFEPNPKRKHL